MAMWHAHPQPLPARTAAMAAGHAGTGPAFVDEDQTIGIEVELSLEPGLALDHDIRALLLAGVRGLFLRV